LQTFSATPKGKFNMCNPTPYDQVPEGKKKRKLGTNSRLPQEDFTRKNLKGALAKSNKGMRKRIVEKHSFVGV